MTNTKKVAQEGWVPDTDSLAARLALVRWGMGWNVAEAERECGLSQNSWANWEAGASPRRFSDVISRIVWRTKVDQYWLMAGPQDGSPTKKRSGSTHTQGNVLAFPIAA